MKRILFFVRRLINTFLIMMLPAKTYQTIPDRFKDFYALVHAYMNIGKKDLFFIMIGACDGVHGDPLRRYISRYNWSGIMVEPVKCLFQLLVGNYANYKKLYFENIAIAEERGVKDFYYLRGFNLDNQEGMKGLGSFLYKNIEDHKKRFPDIEKFVTIEKVKTLTLEDLLEKYNVKNIDLLLIDVEGYEFRIIKTIDFNKIKPSMIWYEYVHLSKDDQDQCQNLLKINGYYFMRRGRDILAYLPLKNV